MSKVLVIKNAGREGPGTIADLFASDGYDMETVFAKKEKIPTLNHDVVLILGAPQSANDSLQYLKDEMNLIREAAQKNIPTLGICLGSQLIARSFGARVYAGPKKEIGFYHDVRVDHASKSGLFEGIADPFTVFHWHGDTFDIPKNATRLAYSEMYSQAFRYGSAVGVQFHLEVNEKIILSWLANAKDLNLSYVDFEKIQSQIDSEIDKVQQNMRIFYRNFKSEFNL